MKIRFNKKDFFNFYDIYDFVFSSTKYNLLSYVFNWLMFLILSGVYIVFFPFILLMLVEVCD